MALRIAKTLLNQSLEVDSNRASELEVMSAIVNATSEDYEEGMKAFKEKRKTYFQRKINPYQVMPDDYGISHLGATPQQLVERF